MQTGSSNDLVVSQTERRIRVLQEDWDEAMLHTIYGLELGDEDFMIDLVRWGRLLKRPRDVRRNGSLSRIALETYLSQRKLRPRRWAATRLGMTPPSLDEVLDGETAEMLPREVLFGRSLVAANLDQILIQVLPALQSRIFGDHNDFCKRLHPALGGVGIVVKPMYCVTSKELDPADPDYSYEYCMITDDPIGLRYNVWLDFKKPMNLAPDTCSTKAYFDPGRHPLLSPFVMGSEPQRPAGLAPTAG
jgi:hypothetical protein